MEALHQYFHAGGYPVMFSILATLIISIGIVFENTTSSTATGSWPWFRKWS
jgi:hypothetical protein